MSMVWYNVRMNIFFGHSTGFDYKHELYKPVRDSDFNKRHEIVFPHEHDEFDNTHSLIQSCDAMFAEASFPSIGLGIELGWAHAYGKPIVCFRRIGSTSSGALPMVTSHIVEYATTEELIGKLGGGYFA